MRRSGTAAATRSDRLFFDGYSLILESDEKTQEFLDTQTALARWDVRMPPTYSDEGLRAALEIGERYPGVGVMVLSQYIESGYAMRLLKHGSMGRGYLLKDRVSDLDGFADAIRRVGQGGSVVDRELVADLVDRRRAPGPLDELPIASASAWR